MTIFDLLFLASCLATLLVLLIIAVALATGKNARAWALVRYLTAGWIAYMALVVSVSTFVPQRILTPGEPQCFDDWCIAVLGAEPVSGRSLQVRVEISSRARGASQSEAGVHLYLVDATGRRSAGTGSCDNVRLDVTLNPGEQEESTCRFQLANHTSDVSLAVGHDGFPIRWFIVGEEAWFRKPTITRLHLA